MGNQQLQEKYKSLIKEKNFIEIARLIKKTGIKPAEYSVRIGVKTYIDEERGLKTRLFSIIKLMEITGINLDANIIQDICKLTLDLGNPYTLGFFSRKIEIGEDNFKNIKGYIQKNYSRYIKEGKLVEITKLIEITKINSSETLVSEGYRNFLEDGNIISFVNLKKRTEVKPSKNLIEEMFKLYKKKSEEKNIDDGENTKEYWLKRIEKLSNATGLKPDE
jgi:hypothetical protein